MVLKGLVTQKMKFRLGEEFKTKALDGRDTTMTHDLTSNNTIRTTSIIQDKYPTVSTRIFNEDGFWMDFSAGDASTRARFMRKK